MRPLRDMARSLRAMKSAQQQPYVLLQPAGDEVRALDEGELAHFRSMQIQHGVPVRFLHRGAATDIVSGQLQDKALPAHLQIHYWNFSKETAQEIALITGTTPVFAN